MHQRVSFLQVWRPILAADELESLVEVRQSLAKLVGLQKSDSEIVIGREFFLTWSLVSRGCGAGFAEELDGPLLVALSLKHHAHVDIELRVRLTMSVPLLQLRHHLHSLVPLPCLLKAHGKVGASLEEGGLRVRVRRILRCYVLILVGFNLDHLLVRFIVEDQSILQVLFLIINQSYIEIGFGKLLSEQGFHLQVLMCLVLPDAVLVVLQSHLLLLLLQIESR